MLPGMMGHEDDENSMEGDDYDTADSDVMVEKTKEEAGLTPSSTTHPSRMPPMRKGF